MNLIYTLIGAIIFFLPGVLLSCILFNKTEIIKRLISILLFSTSISVLAGIILYYFNIFNRLNFIIILISITFALLIGMLCSKREYKTIFDKGAIYIVLFTLIGVLWRLFFIRSIKNPSDAYSYAFSFVGKEIPDLGFYTGMAIDHSRFIGGYIFNEILSFLNLKEFFNIFGTFLYLFLFLSFIYLVFLNFRDKKLAYFAVAIMSLGPIELFYSASGYFGHAFSYLSLFSLFLLFKEKENYYFFISLSISSIMIFTYVTSSIITLLASLGFIAVLIIKGIPKKIDKKKILFFLMIILISSSFLLFSYNDNGSKSSNAELVIRHLTNYPISKYTDPVFLGLSAIRWQMLFFFLCGVTLITHAGKRIIKKEKISDETFDLIFCIIPVLIVSLGFIYVNYPARVFNYFSFFGLLALKLPKKYYKYFFIFSFIFLLATGYYVMQDKKIFFENSDKEIEGAVWISYSLNGTVFCDQQFANLLIKKGYYNVGGARDGDPLVHALFYQNDNETFLEAIKNLSEKNINYIAITKRMQEKFILMVDVPQKPLENINLYEENLEKIYDNGDVKGYEIK